MTKLEQIISCPNCQGYGWRRIGNNDYHECPVCETRGRLVIDGDKTLDLPLKNMPRGGERIDR